MQKKLLNFKQIGPFHTVKLEEAAKKLKIELNKIEINNNFRKQIIKNIDSKIYQKEDDIREILSKHVMNPVKFKDSIEKMIELGADTFIEIGPGKVLSGFVRRVSKDVNVINIQDKESLDNVIKTFKL